MAEPVEVDLKPGNHAWCTCALSANQPFCDGSHKNTDKTPKVFTIREAETAYLCVCKKTGNPPYCDGSHNG